MKTLKILLSAFLYFYSLAAIAQVSKPGLTPPNTVFNHFREHYDQGFLAAGSSPVWYNLNYGLIAKTDINGNILWKRFVGETGSLTSFSKVWPTFDGGFAAAGKSYSYGGAEYPLFVKFSACGTLEWSKKIPFPCYGDVESIIEFSDGSYVAMFNVEVDWYSGEGHTILLNMDSQGEVNEIDTISSDETLGIFGIDLLLMPDNHLLIPSGFIAIGGSPVIFKTDKHAEVDWVIYCNGPAESGIIQTDLAPDGSIYSSAGRNYAPNKDHALIFKFRDGNEVWVKSMLPYTTSYPTGPICVINNERFVGGFEDTEHYLAVFDSSGILLSKQTDNFQVQQLNVTSDNKIMARKSSGIGQTPTNILVKYRMSPMLDSILTDSVYNAPHIYDNLCPGTIISDTIEIVPEIITGLPSLPVDHPSLSSLDINPNPANEQVSIKIQSSMNGAGQILVYNAACIAVLEKSISPGQAQLKLNIAELRPGLYLVRYISGNKVLGSVKMIKL